MPNISRSIAPLACVSVGLWLLASCSSDDCTKGATECVSDALIRTCVPGSAGNEWLVSQCGPNETCGKNASNQDDEDAGADKSDAGASKPTGQAACTGTCQVGAHECVSDALARYCVNGGIWQLDACSVGEKCTKGACALSSGSGTVQACAPGAKACASARVAKQCDSDGSAWLESPCAANETCSDNQCTADPKSSCDNGDSCLDNKTAIRCMGQADGYKLEDCKDDTYCEAGHCRGDICVVGATCIGSNQRRTCDGNSYKDSQCAVNQVCQQTSDDAQCVPLQCSPGLSACGDPRDPKVDAKKHFTACVTGVGSGIPEWVSGECTGNTTCNPMLASTSNPCSQLCTQGAQRCANDPLSGVNDGIQACDSEGKWGPIKSCNTGSDSRLQCVVQPNPDATQLPKAICGAPICVYNISNPMVGATGTCQNDQLRKCQADGTLADPTDCEVGVCRTLRSTTAADGHTPAACDTTPECQDGEEVCADSNGVATPRYRSCANGFLGTELKTCDNDAPCYTSEDDKGLRHKLCGADCSPNSRHCNGAGQVEQCDGDGHWGSGQKCAAGSCRSLGNNDASCVLDCVPGTKLCTGSAMVAPDGYHAGTTQEITCSSSGLRSAAKDCDMGKVCRVSDSGAALGCVECLGPSAPGGNDEGTADSRCDPSDSKKVQECGADNTWTSGRNCANGKACVGPSAGSCGTCPDGNGMMVVCSQAMLPNGGTCASLGYGAPSAWGGVTDCCANYQLGASSAASFAYCK
jgi:hypothetical protein